MRYVISIGGLQSKKVLENIKYTVCLQGLRLLGTFTSFIMYVCLSLHPAVWNNSAATGWIFMKFHILSIFQKSVKKIQVSLKSVKDKGYYMPEDLCIFTIVSNQILRMRNVSDEICV
jgi:hypothetical protein